MTLKKVFQNDSKEFLSFAAVLLVFWLVQFPSLFHAARGDQLLYLAETASITSFGDLLRYSFSYTHIRLLEPGDAFLFRPMFYFILAVEKFFFGYQFFFWQLTGLLLQSAILWKLWRLLKLIGDDPLILLVVLNFGVFYLGQEMVVWHHLHGYLICFLGLLAATNRSLWYLQSLFRREPVSIISLLYCSLWLTVACLAFEFAIIAAFFLGIVVAYRSWVSVKAQSFWKVLCFYLFPVLLYFILNYLDVIRFNVASAPSFLMNIDWGNIVLNMLSTAGLLLSGLIFPAGIEVQALARAELKAVSWERLIHQPVLGLLNLFLCLGIIALIVFVIKDRRKNRTPLKVGDSMLPRLALFLGGGLFLLYVLFILLGRLQNRDLSYLLYSPYHFYPQALFLTIAGWGFCCGRSTTLPVRKIILGVFLLSIFINAVQSFSFNSTLSKEDRSWAEFIGQTEIFVREHRDEPDFSIHFVWSESEKQGITHLGREKNARPIAMYSSFSFFYPYLKWDKAKYFLVYTNEGGLEVYRDLKLARQRASAHLTQKFSPPK